jgi:pSer/pThr/pTyr-binding forkhead associated (FHA) protein
MDKGQLLITKGFGVGTRFRLGRRTLTVGRDKGNLVQIIDDQVSRRHVLVRWTEAGYVLQDLDSQNGTRVNGQDVVGEWVLSEGDTIQIGDSQLKLVEDVPGIRDATLERKVADHQITDRETRLSSPSDDSDDLLTVSLDKRETAHQTSIAGMIREIQSSPGFMECALNLIAEHIGPDRVIVYRVHETSALRALSYRFDADLAKAEKQTRPYFSVIRETITSGARAIQNRVPRHEEGGPQIATAMAVSLGKAVGVVYLDSFSNHPKYFVESDAKILDMVAWALSRRLEASGTTGTR